MGKIIKYRFEKEENTLLLSVEKHEILPGKRFHADKFCIIYACI